MIILYELSWSHYCEKVRLALDYMQLPWRAVSIDAFKKEPVLSFPPHYAFTLRRNEVRREAASERIR